MSATVALEIPPKPEPGARRPYTRTERQREASRRNIRRAQEAACRLMRQPGYMPSERRKAAVRASLQRANEARLRDRSCRYTACFRDGLSVLDLERSLEMAGESPSEYRAHMEWFERVFSQGCEGAESIHKLARALGQATWRRLRVFHTLPEWELLAVCHGLRRLVWERREREVVTPDRLLEWAHELEVFTLADARLDGLSKAWTLTSRVEALASQLLLERGEEGFKTQGGHGETVSNFDELTVEALGNSLRPAREVTESFHQRRVQVAPISDWNSFGSRAPSVASSALSAAMAVPWLRHTLLPSERRQEAEGSSSTPRCFEDFLKLVQEALEGQAAGAGGPGPFPTPEPIAPNLDPHSPISGLAQALWARLEFFRQQGERERGELQALQRGYITSLGYESPDAVPKLRPLALRLVRGLRKGEQTFQLLKGYEHRVNKAVYALLVKRLRRPAGSA